MNISKVSKLFLTAVLAAPATLFFAGCSSDDDAAVVLPGSIAPASGQGIWEGTITTEQPGTGTTATYDIAVVFYKPDGVDEGVAVGVVAEPDSDDGVLLFDAGYRDDGVDPADACETGQEDIIVGTAGAEVREFEFITGSAAGPLQRGKFCLGMDGNTLTGTMTFEELGSFSATLQYSSDNIIDSNLDSLANKTWVDNMFGWSEDSSDRTRLIFPGTAIAPGMSAVINSVDQTFSATALDAASTCAGTGKIADVSGSNVFLLGPFPVIPEGEDRIDVTNCTPGVDGLDVDGWYKGLGVLTTDDNDQDQLVTIIFSYGATDMPSHTSPVTPARALYNVFQ